MELISFDYTKADGTETSRVALVATKPSNNYLVTDLTEIKDPAVVESYIQAVQDLKEMHKQEFDELNRLFDLNFKTRSFVPERMTNLKSLKTS